MGDDAFRAFTEGLSRQIRQEERKRLVRLLTATALILAVLLGMLWKERHGYEALQAKLVDQCHMRNVILDKQRNLYRTMSEVEPVQEKRVAWAQILSELPRNRDCADFLR